jgi:hypothetical protein
MKHQAWRLYLIAVLLFAAITFIMQFSLLFRGTEYITSRLTIDDSYYYYQTAWNFHEYGFVTFDGINSTNGVQLLWYWITVLIALLSETKTQFLVSVLAFSFFLNTLSFIFIWKLANSLDDIIFGWLASVVWLFMILGQRFYSVGLENSLHAPVLWALIWQSVVFIQEIHNGRSKRLVLLTGLMIINVWVRLDSAIISVILYVYCLLSLFEAKSFRFASILNDRVIPISFLLVFIGSIIQFLSYHLMGGFVLPISMLVKSSWKLSDGLPIATSVCLLLFMVFVGLILMKFSNLIPLKNGLRSFWGLWASLGVGTLIHVLVTYRVGSYHHFFWYLSHYYIFLTITIAVLLSFIREVLQKVNFVILPNLLTNSIIAITMILSLLNFANWTSGETRLYKVRYHVALWVNDNLPPNAIIASWNAGQIGYFSNRRVINLDGLINGIEYYRRVRVGNETWIEFADEKGVDFIVDYSFDELISDYYKLIKSFEDDELPYDFLIYERMR